MPKRISNATSSTTIVTEGATCPSCGRHDAIITKSNVGLISGFDTTVSHQFCSYNERLEKVIRDIFRFYNLGIEILGGAENENLKVFILNDHYDPKSLVVIRNKILSSLPSFKDVDIEVNKIDKAFCPICGKSEFVNQSENLSCKNDHLTFPAFKYFESFLLGIFWITNDDQETGFDIHTVFGKSPILDIMSALFKEITAKPKANVLYRYSKETGENIVLVTRINASQVEFQKIINILTSGLPNFKIIAKLTDNDKPTMLGFERKSY